MTLRAVAPNFRCTTTSGKTFVEIPHDWDASRYWLNGQIDEEARQRIASILSDGSAEANPVYAEGLAELVDDHRLSKHGYRLPIQLWDAVMGKVCGAVWDKADESAIFERARVLGWRG